MTSRQPLPRLWMMTDERQGAGLLAATARMPRGAGIVFRHYSLPGAERRALFTQMQSIALKRRLVLLLAGPDRLAAAWGADGSHNRDPGRRMRGFRAAPAHSLGELRRAERARANLVFVSPLFATRSHLGRKPMGAARFRHIVQAARVPVMALGGMNPQRGRRAKRWGAYGWAAIDAWSHEC